MYGYIYLITNMLNNKKYIGKRTWNNENTINEDKYMGSGKILKQAFAKYDMINFKKEVLCICYSEEDLSKKEIEYINLYNATQSKEFYNIHEGGKGGNTRKGYSEEEMKIFKTKMKTARKNYKHSDETRKKISDTLKCRENHMKQDKYRKMFSERFKGENNPMYGIPMSEYTKHKLLDSHNGFFAYNKGITMSQEQKDKISNSMKEAWNKDDNRSKWIKSKIGRENSDETKAKMSDSAYKRYGTFPYDNNIIVYKCDNDWNILEIYHGIDEYYKAFNTKTCRNLKYAVRDKTKFKGYYWYVDFESSSTIERVSSEKNCGD